MMARIHSVVQTIMGGNNMHISGIARWGLVVIFICILTGCVKGEQSLEEIDVPQDAEAVDLDLTEDDSPEEDGKVEEDEESKEYEEEIIETIARQLYLVDANGMVAA